MFFIKNLYMKRYMLFSGYNYYPSGGMNDFCGSFNTIEECEVKIKMSCNDWFHVYDIVECKMVINIKN